MCGTGQSQCLYRSKLKAVPVSRPSNAEEPLPKGMSACTLLGLGRLEIHATLHTSKCRHWLRPVPHQATRNREGQKKLGRPTYLMHGRPNSRRECDSQLLSPCETSGVCFTLTATITTREPVYWLVRAYGLSRPPRSINCCWNSSRSRRVASRSNTRYFISNRSCPSAS